MEILEFISKKLIKLVETWRELRNSYQDWQMLWLTKSHRKFDKGETRGIN